MKKVQMILLIIMISLFCGPNAFAAPTVLNYDGQDHVYQDGTYGVSLNGELLSGDSNAFVINDRALIAARRLVENLGGTISWTPVTRTVEVTLNETKILLAIDLNQVIVNGEYFELDVPAKLINGKTMIPLRFVAEKMGCQVGWYPEKQIITVDLKQPIDKKLGTLSKATFEKNGDVNCVRVLVDEYSKYHVTRLDAPDRIILDFYDVKINRSGAVIVSSPQVSVLRMGQYKDTIARVVIDTQNKLEYRIDDTQKDFKIYLYPQELTLPDTTIPNEHKEEIAAINEKGTQSALYPKSTPLPIKNDKIQKFIYIATEEYKKRFLEKDGDNITSYGAWYGQNGIPWCAMFVSWCASEAGLLNTLVPKFALCSDGVNWYSQKNRYKVQTTGYIPKAGDLVLFKNSGSISHTGIVVACDLKKVYTIEGNASNSVQYRSYLLTEDCIDGYGVNGETSLGAIPQEETTDKNDDLTQPYPSL